MKTTSITFDNSLSFDLLFAGERLRGIGAVRLGSTPLRSAAVPWMIHFESETGFSFSPDRLLDLETSGTAATLTIRMAGAWMPRLQDADAMGDARIRAPRQAEVAATMRWRFHTVEETLAENRWTGLAMGIEVECPGHPIHWLLEAATWEIGGAAAGCTLIQQDVSCIDLEQSVQADSVFSTIERFHTEGAGAWGGSYPMDMMPRAAGAAICDFQSKDDTALCLFAEAPGLTRSRLEKRAEENVIHHLDRPFFPLGESVASPERKLLVYRHPAALARHERRNLWLDCFAEVRDRICSTYGFTPEVPLPCIHSHLWDGDLKARGAAWRTPLEKALPLYQRLGWTEFFTHGVWDSVTSDPERRPGEGNICCPYAFRYAEAFGGAAGMKALFDVAHAEGVEAYQWFGFQFARYAALWKEHPEWLLREANGDPWDGNYDILWCGRMRTPFRDLLYEQIAAVKEETGLDHIFWDSYHNLGVTCVDWQAPDKAPQAEEVFRFQAALQKLGFKQRCETVTIFGVSQVALYGFENDAFRRRLWADTVRNDDAFALFDTAPCFFSKEPPLAPGRIGPEEYFWLLAHRAVPMAGADPWAQDFSVETPCPAWPGGIHAEAYAACNRIYHEALPQMHRMRLAADGTHTIWLDRQGRPAVVWAFEPGSMDYTGPVQKLREGATDTVRGQLSLAAGEVYRLAPPQEAT